MSYDKIDRFLRNNLGDDDYAEYSAALDELCAPQPPAQPATYTCGVCGVSMQMEQPAQQQEPVAWLDEQHLVMRSDWRDRANYKGPWVDFGRAIPNSWVPVLYTSQPAQRKPLTDEQVAELRRLHAIEDAAKNLVKVRGHYHTEQAFNQLKELLK